MRNFPNIPCLQTMGLALVIALLTASANAQEAYANEGVARFSETGKQLVLSPYVRWVVDESLELTLDEAIEALKDSPLYGGDSEWFELGQLDNVVWLAVTIENSSNTDDLVFEFRNPRMSYVDFYQPNGAGGFDLLRSGVALPFNVRTFDYPMPAFPLNIAPGDSKTVYLRLENRGDFRQRIWLWDSVAFTNRVATAYHSDVLSIGVLVALSLYQLLIFLMLRERSYLYLFCFVVSWAIFLMASTGLAKMYLFQDWYWLNQRTNSFFLVCMLISFLLFSQSFLQTRHLSRPLHWIGRGLTATFVAYIVYISVVDTLLRMTLNPYLVLVTMFYLLTLALYGLYKKSRNARLFLASWAFMLTGASLMLLLTWYILPSGFVLGTPIISVLFAISIVGWSLELIFRVRLREREQRKLLEAQVEERTRELRQALNEVKTLSGLLPICSSCKKIRDDQGYWQSVEYYIGEHAGVDFTHGICPECTEALYPEFAAGLRKRLESNGSGNIPA